MNEMYQTDWVETDLNRTNNHCESFNKTFSDVVGHSNPTIYLKNFASFWYNHSLICPN